MIFWLFALHLIVYWSSVLGFTIYYGEQKEWKKAKVLNAAKRVLVNQLVYTPLYFIPFTYYYPKPLHYLHGLWQIPCIVVLTDIIFYTTHRAFHHPLLYKHVHSWHHDVYPPIAATALYAHPLEHVLVNLLSTLAPLFIVHASMPVVALWTTFTSFNVVSSHSETDGLHTAHHTHRQCNYGVGFYWMDDLFRTLKLPFNPKEKKTVN